MKLQFAQLREASSSLIALIRGPQDRFLAEGPRGLGAVSTIFNGLQRCRFHHGGVWLRNVPRQTTDLNYRLSQLELRFPKDLAGAVSAEASCSTLSQRQ
jgi:hypothetical protein